MSKCLEFNCKFCAMYYFLAIELTVINEVLMFDSSNENNPLCATVQSRDDSFVESPMIVTLMLEIGIQNDRILISPSSASLILLDNDSKENNRSL